MNDVEFAICPSGWVELRDPHTPGAWIASSAFWEILE